VAPKSCARSVFKHVLALQTLVGLAESVFEKFKKVSDFLRKFLKTLKFRFLMIFLEIDMMEVFMVSKSASDTSLKKGNGRKRSSETL